MKKIRGFVTVSAMLIAVMGLALFSGCGGGGSSPIAASGSAGSALVDARVTFTGRSAGRVVAAEGETVAVDVAVTGYYDEDGSEFDPVTASVDITLTEGVGYGEIIGLEVPIGTNHLLVATAEWSTGATETLKYIIEEVIEGQSQEALVDEKSTVVAEASIIYAAENDLTLNYVPAWVVDAFQATVDYLGAPYSAITSRQMSESLVPALVSVSPATAVVPEGDTEQFTAAISNSYELAIGYPPTWSVSGDIGTVSSTGLFTATDIGDGAVIATAGTASDTAIISVTPGGSVAGLTSYFPSAVGDRWGYTSTYSGEGLVVESGSEDVVYINRAMGSKTIEGVETTEFRYLSYLQQQFYTMDSEGVKLVGEGSMMYNDGASTFSPAILMYKDNLSAGDQWTYEGASVSEYDNMTITATGTFVGVVDVTTAAGTFTDCLKYYMELTFASEYNTEIAYKTTYIAPGIGVVKMVESYDYNYPRVASKETEDLGRLKRAALGSASESTMDLAFYNVAGTCVPSASAFCQTYDLGTDYWPMNDGDVRGYDNTYYSNGNYLGGIDSMVHVTTYATDTFTGYRFDYHMDADLFYSTSEGVYYYGEEEWDPEETDYDVGLYKFSEPVLMIPNGMMPGDIHSVSFTRLDPNGNVIDTSQAEAVIVGINDLYETPRVSYTGDILHIYILKESEGEIEHSWLANGIGELAYETVCIDYESEDCESGSETIEYYKVGSACSSSTAGWCDTYTTQDYFPMAEGNVWGYGNVETQDAFDHTLRITGTETIDSNVNYIIEDGMEGYNVYDYFDATSGLMRNKFVTTKVKEDFPVIGEYDFSPDFVIAPPTIQVGDRWTQTVNIQLPGGGAAEPFDLETTFYSIVDTVETPSGTYNNVLVIVLDLGGGERDIMYYADGVGRVMIQLSTYNMAVGETRESYRLSYYELDGVCTAPYSELLECSSDTDCDDGDSLTLDTCVEPRTCQSMCTHTNLD
ncbi:MAG TPA: Ig-like domain-containing protein [bacterium]|nr:Ig-like domain-containing protein [bacterium]